MPCWDISFLLRASMGALAPKVSDSVVPWWLPGGRLLFVVAGPYLFLTENPHVKLCSAAHGRTKAPHALIASAISWFSWPIWSNLRLASAKFHQFNANLRNFTIKWDTGNVERPMLSFSFCMFLKCSLSCNLGADLGQLESNLNL